MRKEYVEATEELAVLASQVRTGMRLLDVYGVDPSDGISKIPENMKKFYSLEDLESASVGLGIEHLRMNAEVIGKNALALGLEKAVEKLLGEYAEYNAKYVKHIEDMTSKEYTPSVDVLVVENMLSDIKGNSLLKTRMGYKLAEVINEKLTSNPVSVADYATPESIIADMNGDREGLVKSFEAIEKANKFVDGLYSDVVNASKMTIELSVGVEDGDMEMFKDTAAGIRKDIAALGRELRGELTGVDSKVSVTLSNESGEETVAPIVAYPVNAKVETVTTLTVSTEYADMYMNSPVSMTDNVKDLNAKIANGGKMAGAWKSDMLMMSELNTAFASALEEYNTKKGSDSVTTNKLDLLTTLMSTHVSLAGLRTVYNCNYLSYLANDQERVEGLAKLQHEVVSKTHVPVA